MKVKPPLIPPLLHSGKTAKACSRFGQEANATCSAGARAREACPSRYDLRFSRYFGTSRGCWLRLQLDYDLVRAERENGERIQRKVQPHPA